MTKQTFSQLALVTAILATFPLLSQAAYYDDDITISQNETVFIKGNTGGILAYQKDTSLTILDGYQLTVSGSVSEADKYAYGVEVFPTFSLGITGNLKVDITSTGNAKNALAFYLLDDASFSGSITAKAATNAVGKSAFGLYTDDEAGSDTESINFGGTLTKLEAEAAAGSTGAYAVGSRSQTTINFNADQTTLSASGAAAEVYGIDAYYAGRDSRTSSTINFAEGQTQIYATGLEGNSDVFGVRSYLSTINFKGNTNIEVTSASTSDMTRGVHLEATQWSDPYKTAVNFDANAKIEVNSKGSDAVAVFTSGAKGVTFNGASINIVTSTTKAEAVGVLSQYGSAVKMTNENSVVTVDVDSVSSNAFGLFNNVYGGGSTQGQENQFGSISIAGQLDLDVTGAGKTVAGIYNGTNDSEVYKNNEIDGVTISGGATIDVTATGADSTAYGIYAENGENGKSKTSVNNLVATIIGSDGAASYGINGTSASLTTVTGTSTITAKGENAYGVNLTQNSVFNVAGSLGIVGDTEGVVIDTTSTMNVQENAAIKTSSMQSNGNTTMANGSQLTVDGTEGTSSALGNIDGNNATINFVAGDYTLETMTGENSTYYVETEKVQTTVTDNQSTGLLVTTNSDVTDALKGESLDKLVTFEKGGEGVKYFMPEGMYEGEQSGTYGEDGKIASRTVKVNSLMQSTLELASAAPLAMNRIMMSDLRKRMGDIRTDTNTNGAWARYEGGRLSGSNGLENDFNTIQVGGDTKLGDWRVGGAFNYTKGDVDYARGDADMDAYGLSAYGLWLGSQGQFVDIVARVSKADTDMKVDGYKTGSMDSMAYSLSGEFGWRFALSDMVYIEPQVEAAYTYVDADDADIGTASYKFDSVNSFIGRAGFATGIKCPSNFGDVYFHASALHEFSGDSEITGGNGSKYSVDGKDTWFEYGLGANFNINKATYVWADVQRTSGADLDEDWRANIGVRYSF